MNKTMIRCAALVTLLASVLLPGTLSRPALMADGGVLPGIPPIYGPHGAPAPDPLTA